jgi:hypothetical protein
VERKIHKVFIFCQLKIQQRGETGYLVMTIVKMDNYSTNWKDFLAANGTLDLNKA